MKIFIDINHPAHVHYFRNLIKIMKVSGHQFLITARDKEITHELLNNYGLKYESRGKGKKSLIGKIIYAIKADYLIYKLASKWKPDIFLSFGSPYPAQVSRILKTPSVSITDTEHAFLGILAFAPFTDVILTPYYFKKELGQKQIRFKSFMELAYLHANYFVPNPEVLSHLKVIENEKFAIIRFVSWNASHDIGEDGLSNDDKIKLVEAISTKLKVFISSEGQIPTLLEKYKFVIPSHYMHDALCYATVYIGEGATTASESVMLGTPAIFMNNLIMGTINEQKEAGLLFQTRGVNDTLEQLNEILKQNKTIFNEKRKILLNNQIDLTKFLVSFLESYPVKSELSMQKS